MPGQGDFGAVGAGSRGCVSRDFDGLSLPSLGDDSGDFSCGLIAPAIPVILLAGNHTNFTGRGAMRIMIINGPNLNMLGIREPHIYGSTTLEAIKAACEEFAHLSGAQLSFHQSNHEGVMVDLIQSARTQADAIIINPAAYSFTSIAIFDALKIFEGPIFEVHISNIHARDELHRHSKLSAAVKAVIAGLGPYGYIVAMQAALQGAGKLPAAWPAAVRVGPK
jgi:3-dehydroquinate dehydratase II